MPLPQLPVDPRTEVWLNKVIRTLSSCLLHKGTIRIVAPGYRRYHLWGEAMSSSAWPTLGPMGIRPGVWQWLPGHLCQLAKNTDPEKTHMRHQEAGRQSVNYARSLLTMSSHLIVGDNLMIHFWDLWRWTYAGNFSEKKVTWGPSRSFYLRKLKQWPQIFFF